MKNWLVIYDIRNEKRLAKIAREVKNYGTRVQQSVFEIIADARAIDKLRKKIRSLMADEDFVVYFDICHEDWQKQLKYGPEEFTIREDKDYEIL